MSDGASVYECTSNDEVIDLLQGGQGVFGIAIGGVWREIEGTLAELPSERAAEDARTSPATSSPHVARPARSADPTACSPATPVPSASLRDPQARLDAADDPARESRRRGHPWSRAERRRGNSSPEPLRRPDRADQATLEDATCGATEGEAPADRRSREPPCRPPDLVRARRARPSSTATSACAPPTSRRCWPPRLRLARRADGRPPSPAGSAPPATLDLPGAVSEEAAATRAARRSPPTTGRPRR